MTTIATSIAAITDRCENLIAVHVDPDGTGACKHCDAEYPCRSRLVGEQVIEDLDKLSHLESPGASVLGYPPFMREPS